MKMLSDDRKNTLVPEINLPEELQWLNRNTNRNYYNAIWSTLVTMKPKYCLEIGTFLYYSAKIFSRYFDQYMPDGKLVTCDIALWNRDPKPPKNVYPIIFWPYDINIEDEHGGINVYYDNYKEVITNNLSLELNTSKLFFEMTDLDIKKFDFTFVDGSHSSISFISDLNLTKLFTKKTGYIMIDDIYQSPTDPEYGQFSIYKRLKLKNNFYEFENWPISPNISLIKCENLTI